MNTYKQNWAAHAGQLNETFEKRYRSVKREVKEFANLSPTSPRRMIAHSLSLPIAIGADLASTTIFATGVGPGYLAVGASVVSLAALAYFTWSAAELYGPPIKQVLSTSPYFDWLD